jgi:hypothetical protein
MPHGYKPCATSEDKHECVTECFLKDFHFDAGGCALGILFGALILGPAGAVGGSARCLVGIGLAVAACVAFCKQDCKGFNRYCNTSGGEPICCPGVFTRGCGKDGCCDACEQCSKYFTLEGTCVPVPHRDKKEPDNSNCICRAEFPNACGDDCCKENQTCCDGGCCDGECVSNAVTIGRVVGLASVAASTGSMCCPRGQACGDRCCPAGQRCDNGTCTACTCRAYTDTATDNGCCPPDMSCWNIYSGLYPVCCGPINGVFKCACPSGYGTSATYNDGMCHKN